MIALSSSAMLSASGRRQQYRLRSQSRRGDTSELRLVACSHPRSHKVVATQPASGPCLSDCQRLCDRTSSHDDPSSSRAHPLSQLRGRRNAECWSPRLAHPLPSTTHACHPRPPLTQPSSQGKPAPPDCFLLPSSHQTQENHAVFARVRVEEPVDHGVLVAFGKDVKKKVRLAVACFLGLTLEVCRFMYFAFRWVV